MNNSNLGLFSSTRMIRLLDLWSVKMAIYMLFASYFFWELYWFSQVGLTFIRWHTHLAFPIYFFGFFYFISKKLNFSPKYLKGIFYIFISVFLFEILILLTGVGMTYSEKKFGHFVLHPKNGTEVSYYWIDEPHYLKPLKTKEFSYTRKTNSIGYSDIEWTKKKTEGVLRALALGDSFTEGDGAHADSNYVAHFRRLVKNSNKPLEVMNAGKCGSDPFFNFMNYKYRLMDYQPDIIFQTISTQDLISDIATRGGMERFMPDYELRFQNINQLSKFIYGISFFSRPFFHLFGVSYVIEKAHISDSEKAQISKDVINLIKNYHRISSDNHCQLILIFFPLKEEVLDGYESITKEIMNDLSKDYFTIDLRNFYLKQKTTNGYKEYYWKEDGHHNSRGYKMMAEGIYDAWQKHNKQLNL